MHDLALIRNNVFYSALVNGNCWGSLRKHTPLYIKIVYLFTIIKYPF